MLDIDPVNAFGHHARALRAEVAVKDARLYLVVLQHLCAGRRET
jgi:hypothetical protein